VALADGTFWISDEYGPWLVHVDADGRTLERIGPFPGPKSLPKVLALRRPNRGMESLTITSDGKTLVGMMQNPVDNPDTSIRKTSRLNRVVAYDPRTGASRQYAYLLDATSAVVSEIAAVTHSTFIVHRFGKAFCEIDIAVRVDRDSHRQSASSTRSWASIASSKPGTSTHAPTRASRSVCTRSGRSVPSASRIRAFRNTSLRLWRPFCALRLSALSTCAGTLRTVYWTVGREGERSRPRRLVDPILPGCRACLRMQALCPRTTRTPRSTRTSPGRRRMYQTIYSVPKV